MDSLHRLLELVRRELRAEDARIEIGGREPADDRIVWCYLPQGWRVVAVMAEPPDDATRATTKLEALVEAFVDLPDAARQRRPTTTAEALRRELDDELAALATRVGAVGAVLVDDNSPVLWGSSDLYRSVQENTRQMLDDLEAAERFEAAGIDLGALLGRPTEQAAVWLHEQGIDRQAADPALRHARQMSARSTQRDPEGWRRHMVVAAAIRDAIDGPPREVVRDGSPPYLTRTFGGVYRLVLAFDRAFSALHAEGAAIHAVPWLEKLVLKLPPVDPGPGDDDDGSGGKPARVVRLRG